MPRSKHSSFYSYALNILLYSSVVQAFPCPESSNVFSCTEQAETANSCCIPQPGLFSLTQKWDSTQGKWYTSDFDILKCDGTPYTCEGDQDNVDIDPPQVETTPEIESVFRGRWYQKASCISTLSKACAALISDTSDQRLVLANAIKMFAPEIDTRHFLAAEWILLETPSNSRFYTLRHITSALSRQSALQAIAQCTGDYLTSVEYRFVTQDRFQDMKFTSPKHLSWGEMDAQIQNSNCPPQHVRYGYIQDAGAGSYSGQVTPPVVDSSIDGSTGETKPIVKKLGFFKQKHEQRAPDEKVWQPAPEPTKRSFGRVASEL